VVVEEVGTGVVVGATVDVVGPADFEAAVFIGVEVVTGIVATEA
jgi:hypothetical protein